MKYALVSSMLVSTFDMFPACVNKTADLIEHASQ